MITYVNTVLVSNANGTTLATAANLQGVSAKADLAANVGKFVIMDTSNGDIDDSALYISSVADLVTVESFKIGVVTKDYYTRSNNGQLLFVPIVKWSNEIKIKDIKHVSVLNYRADSEDAIAVDFTQESSALNTRLAEGGIPVVLRLTFKDMPTRFRNWTESYDYITKVGDTATQIAAGLADAINVQKKRARVYASANAGVLTLTAMEYDDDNSADTENLYGKVRFNAHCWYSDPTAPGFASSNKYSIGSINKIAGYTYPASAKLVRDREHLSRGYQGLLHYCKWYDPKPATMANLDFQYGGLVIEFENDYLAADDVFRRVKQTVEIYASNNGTAVAGNAIAGGLAALAPTVTNIDRRTDSVTPAAA